MPTLPTITIPQAQFDRVVAAFPGATLTEKAKAYEDWLVNHLIDRVEQVEARAIDEAANVDKAARLAALRASLPARRGAA